MLWRGGMGINSDDEHGGNGGVICRARGSSAPVSAYFAGACRLTWRGVAYSAPAARTLALRTARSSARRARAHIGVRVCRDALGARIFAARAHNARIGISIIARHLHDGRARRRAAAGAAGVVWIVCCGWFCAPLSRISRAGATPHLAVILPAARIKSAPRAARAARAYRAGISL